MKFSFMMVKKWLVVSAFWVVFMTSSLAVVFMTHKTRLATHELEQLKNEQANLQVQSGQLLLEKSSLAAFVRVERLAVSRLGMSVPKAERVVIVRP